MEAIKIEVTGNIAKVIEKPLRITSGTVGLPVEFVFDSHWDNMTKVAVFNTGIVIKNMKIVDNATVVPIEALAVPGLNLSIGVYGVSEDGAVATPTVWASVGQIRHGAVPGSSFGSDIGTAKKYYDLGEQAAEKADASAKKAEEAAELAKEVADSVGSPVSYKPQTIPEKNRVQAKENIGASTYYHTKREASWGKADVDANGNLPTQYVWDLYDALADKYNRYEVDKNGEKIPLDIRVRKVDCSIGDFEQYAYEISTGDYSTDAAYVQHYGNNPPIKKPKYLVLSGIHGIERKAVFSTYRFFRDLLSGHNIPAALREGAIFSVMPVGTPNSFDLFIRNNAPTVYDEAGKVVSEGVNINRNFNAENPEKETQAIMNWLNANADADLFIDVHNNGALNEKVLILGLPDNTTSNTARKTALRGVDNIIPYWRDVIGYPDKVEAAGLDGTITNRAVIYSYTATINTDGLSIKYAQNVVGIPSITIELASFYGSTTEWLDGTWKDGKLVPGKNAKKADSPEAVAMGAEALGNILIEFYEKEEMLFPAGTPIYNGETVININGTQTQIYNGEVE